MPHVLKDLTTVSSLADCHEVFTHSRTWVVVGLCIRPVGVRSCSHPFVALFSHENFKWLVDGTSKGCNWLVSPPEITARWVFSSLSLFFAASVICAINRSSTNRAGFSEALQDVWTLLFLSVSSCRFHPSILCREHEQ